MVKTKHSINNLTKLFKILVLPILAFFVFAHQVITTGAISTLPEQPFLDIAIQENVDNTTKNSELTESWASEYVESIRQKRYGDAVWARHHMSGEVENGLIG